MEYLLSKVEHERAEKGDLSWSALSLALAMRGMEGEEKPTYTTADLKVTFS